MLSAAIRGECAWALVTPISSLRHLRWPAHALEVVGDWTPVPGQPWVTKLGESFVNDLGASALPSDWHRPQYRTEGVTAAAGKAHERPITALP
jgi:hypothetical protein